MNETQKNKITRFLDDKIMSDSVYDILLKSFLRKKSGDIHMQAALFLAVGLLDDAWKELEIYRVTKEVASNQLPQIGL